MSLQLTIKTPDSDTGTWLGQLSGTLETGTLAALAPAFGGSAGAAIGPLDKTIAVTGEKISEELYGLTSSGTPAKMRWPCNASPNGNYATYLTHYFRLFSDSISGRAVHRIGDQFVDPDITGHDGHLCLQ